jgi:hypothetical protein
MTYKPKPIDTSSVVLPPTLLQFTERLAENAHHLWAQQRFAENWEFGAERNDELKTNPNLVPYEGLPESEKDYDRTNAMETLMAVVALGYQNVAPENKR